MGLGTGLNGYLTVGLLSDSNGHGTGCGAGLPTKGTGSRYPLWAMAAAAGINVAYVGSSIATPPTPDADVPSLARFHDGIDGGTIGSSNTLWTSRGWQVPEVVIIWIGVNDCIAGTAAQTSATALDALALLVWNTGQRPGVNKTKLVELCMIPQSPTNQTITTAFNALIPGIVADHAARGRNIKLVDMFTPMGANTAGNAGPLFNAASTPHPNDAGYVVCATAAFGTRGSGLLCDYSR